VDPRGPKRSDLSVSGRFIEMRRTLKDGGRVYPPKNGKIRGVDMSLQLADELNRHRVEHSREALAKRWGAQPWIFLSSEGAAQAKLLQAGVQSLLRKAGLRRVRPHALRHTFVVSSLRRLAPRAGLEPATS